MYPGNDNLMGRLPRAPQLAGRFESMKKRRNENSAEDILRSVLDGCADCDTCRYLMDESCLLFPELYRLYDKEQQAGVPVHQGELRRMADLCTCCGLCPCPNIPADVIQGKTAYVHGEGLPLDIRLLADVQRALRLAGTAPGIINRILSMAPLQRLAKKMAGIHPRRSLPQIAARSFFAWAHQKGLDREPAKLPGAAYFAGCTAGYLFPEVARATVAVLEKNGVSVYVPPQQCCGMPTLLEGDADTTLARVRSNLKTLLQAVHAGYDLVCSCPTCGFLMKILLKANAYYAPAYQQSINAGEDHIVIPDRTANGYVHLKRSIYDKILKDDGYFSAINPLDRIALSNRIRDLGEYLHRLQQANRLNTRFGRLEGRMALYTPCHQREQEIGRPYQDLLARIPGLIVQPVGNTMDCCGMGGSLGFKKNFHDASLNLGRPLMQKIRAADPDAIITECLSCRLQFQHMLPYPVFHPLEIIDRSYKAAQE